MPTWLDTSKLLGPGVWRYSPLDGAELMAEADLPAAAAADLVARLRGVGLAGARLVTEVEPRLGRGLIRAARLVEARRHRQGSVGFSRGGARLDAEARWSLTPELLALALGQRAGALHVFDAGCGAGGNAIGFARAGCAVTAVDESVARLAMARHNAALYGVAQRIAFVAGDARALVTGVSADLMFIDAPWGRDYDKMRVVLSDLPLLAGLLEQRARFARVWAKVPASFDPRSAPAARVEAWFGACAGDERRIKFLLLEFA